MTIRQERKGAVESAHRPDFRHGLRPKQVASLLLLLEIVTSFMLFVSRNLDPGVDEKPCVAVNRIPRSKLLTDLARPVSLVGLQAMDNSPTGEDHTANPFP